LNRYAKLAAQIVVAAALIAGGIWVILERDAALALIGVAPSSPMPAGRTAQPDQPVLTRDVEGSADDLKLQAVGTGSARRSVTLKADASGQIVSINFEAGSRVKAGQPLMTLADRQERLALDLAKVRLTEAQRNLERFQQLKRRGSATTVILQEAETQAEVARIARDSAATALDKRTIRAPFDGVTGIPLVTPGARVDVETDVVSLDDRSTLRVEFDLPEKYLARLAVGNPVEAQTPAFPGRVFPAEIVEIDSRVDELSRTARVRAEIANTDDLLRPGMSFVVDVFLPGELRAAVPQLAVQWGRNGAYVWRVIDGVAQPAQVQLLGRRDGLVLVEGDVVPGDVVVIEGVQRLRPGRGVTPLGNGRQTGGNGS